MEKHAATSHTARGHARAARPLKKTPYDKRELRARVAERKAVLEAELARLQAVKPQATSTPEQDFISASLAALDGLLAAAGDPISEVTAAEITRWLGSTPFVADAKTRRARSHTK